LGCSRRFGFGRSGESARTHALSERGVFLGKIHKSGREIHISSGEIQIFAAKIHKWKSDLPISSGAICVLLEEMERGAEESSRLGRAPGLLNRLFRRVGRLFDEEKEAIRGRNRWKSTKIGFLRSSSWQVSFVDVAADPPRTIRLTARPTVGRCSSSNPM